MLGHQTQPGSGSISSSRSTTPPAEAAGQLAQLLASPLSDVCLPLSGDYDSFFERRFRLTDTLNVSAMSNSGVIAFLSKSRQIDEYLSVASSATLTPGLYRIRDEGSGEPLVTLKRYAKDSESTAQTIDIVHPSPELLESLRLDGALTVVIDKTRVTYKSKLQPNCLFHVDNVGPLGKFFDVKADDAHSLAEFLKVLGLDAVPAVSESYSTMKLERGVSPLQLKVWRFHRAFEDYILGVVSGTLTPLGFLVATAASGGSLSAMVLTLMSAGICDGLSDSVAASQTTHSSRDATTGEQIKAFLKTMAGKVTIPMTFLPIVLASPSNEIVIGIATLWAGVLLSATATIQAVAHERSSKPAIVKILSWGGATVVAGTFLGIVIPPLFNYWFGIS